jgi:pyridoxine 5-phosphate synthase
MARLSVNVNKIATLRNSRGGNIPSVVDAARVCLEAEAPGITVHPRADQRHITPTDVRELAEMLAPYRQKVEFNIEGDPRPDLLALVHEVRPHQCTLVPVRPGEVTSEAGWPPEAAVDALRGHVTALREAGVRVSMFIDPTPEAVRWAADLGADRVELYTEPYARTFATTGADLQACLGRYARASALASDLGLGVNAGHDLDLENLPDFVHAMPRLDEVSIGHAIISYALYVGLRQAVREYIEAVQV